MKPTPASRRAVAQAAAAAALLGLTACAGAHAPPAVEPEAAAAAAPLVTMAPIANPEPPPAAHREPAPRARVAEPARHPEPVRPAHAPNPNIAPAQTLDPASAARLRARGLEELNRGQVAKAVALLSQASRLDPGNAVIRRDLERAERISRVVHRPH